MVIYRMYRGEKPYSISYLQIHNYKSQRFLKTMERTQIDFNEVTPEVLINVESIINNTKVIPIN